MRCTESGDSHFPCSSKQDEEDERLENVYLIKKITNVIDLDSLSTTQKMTDSLDSELRLCSNPENFWLCH